MCACLRTLPPEAGLDTFTATLARLVEREAAYPAAKDPAAVLGEMHRLTDDLWEAAAPLGGVDPRRVGYRGVKSYDFYEDVLRASPRPDDPAAPVFSMHAPQARAALRTGELLVRLSTLFDPAHELRATLADVAAERWPGRDEMGVLELFQAVQPLWRDYLEFRAQGWGGGDPRRTWNPRGLAQLNRLHAWRKDVFGALVGCGVEDGDVWRVNEAVLRALLDGVPPRYTDTAGRGACLLLQPASRDGSLWRLNRLMEGTGRCGSRYTPVMDAHVRRRYTAHLAVRGWAKVDGERAALLDLQCVHGDTLNVHAPQTPALLSLPGDEADVEPGRRLRLRELRVCFHGSRREPVLRGPSGERLLPAHLGLSFEAYLPPLVRFLASLGPGALRPVLPPRVGRAAGEVVASRRTLLGSLVLHRQGWSVPAAPLAAALGADDADAFRAVNRLRMAWGIPDRAFVAEPRGTSFKPQYLDFTSPLFLGVLRGVVAGGEERLTLEEMLPDAEMCPRDEAGRRWAVEVALDSITLREHLRVRRRGPRDRRVPQPA